MYRVEQTTSFGSAEMQKLVVQLYPNTDIVPRHFFPDNSKKICVFTSVNKLVGTCTVFENDTLSDSLVIGNYECIQNTAVAKMLFESTTKIAKESDKHFLIGPMNGDTWHAYRFSMLEKPPFIMEQIHKPYYPQQWRENGFETYAEYHTNIEQIDSPISDRMQDFFGDRNLQIRQFDSQHAEQDFRAIYELSKESFSNNFLFQPIDWVSFYNLYKNYLPFIKDDLVDLVFDKNELVGFLFALEIAFAPNQIIVKTMARKSGRKYAGMGRALRERIFSKCIRMQYSSMLHAYIHAENYTNVLSHRVGGQLYQKHILMRKRL